MAAGRTFACALARLVAGGRAAEAAEAMRAVPLDDLECAAAKRDERLRQCREQRTQARRAPPGRHRQHVAHGGYGARVVRCDRATLEVHRKAGGAVERAQEMHGAGEARVAQLAPRRHVHARIAATRFAHEDPPGAEREREALVGERVRKDVAGLEPRGRVHEDQKPTWGGAKRSAPEF